MPEERGDDPPRPVDAENRIPAAAAVLVAMALYALLPNALLPVHRLLVPALELVLFVPLLLANPVRMTRESSRLRSLAIALVVLILLANLLALVLLCQELVAGDASSGSRLLVAAVQVWATNVLVFALAYWELDRGGAVRRSTSTRQDIPAADFRFPQDEDADTVAEVAQRSSEASGWLPAFWDYLYVSVTNSSAFSPTDTMPLSHRAKLLMAMQSVSALLLSVLVIARGVSLLA